MSLSELLIPNTLDLFCSTMTTSSLTPIVFNSVMVNGAHYEGCPLDVKGRQVGATIVDKLVGFQASTNVASQDDYDIRITRNVGSNDLSLNSSLNPNILYYTDSSSQLSLMTNATVPGYDVNINGAVNMESNVNIQGAAGMADLIVSATSSLAAANATSLDVSGISTLATTNCTALTSSVSSSLAVASCTSLSFPNSAEPSTGSLLTFYESLVVPTNFTDAIGPVASNLRLSRVGKSVVMSVDGIAFTNVLNSDPIRCSGVIPSRFLPDFNGTSNIAYFDFTMNYSDVTFGTIATSGVLSISTSGGIEMFIKQPIQLQGVGVLGLTSVDVFADSNGVFPAGLGIQIGWDSINFSWYCGA